MTREPTTEMSRDRGGAELRERDDRSTPDLVQRGERGGVAQVGSALEDVLHAGQRLVADRIDLARLEVKEASQRIVAGVVAGAVGAFLLAYAWVVVMSALIGWISMGISAPVAYLLVGLVNAMLGASLALAGVQRMRKPRGGDGLSHGSRSHVSHVGRAD